MKGITMVAALVIMMMMSGMAVAEGDQTYGMMSSECPDCAECTDVMDAMDNLPFAQFDAMFADVSSMEATTTSGIVIEEEWAYGRRNEVPEGMLHVYYDFEEGQNLGVFRNAHPDVASFENVSNSHCCYPACGDNNEPSYVRQGAHSGPRCQCIMYIYPTPRTFKNGTDIPYIHVVNGRAAFAPRVEVGGMRCYYPACSAFIGFKDGTNYVSFLASTNWNLYVEAFDKQGKYLGGRTIYYTTDRIGNGSSNFTRFTMHLPDTAIGYLTFKGPFNGWHIDDLIVGDTPGYLSPDSRRDYGWAAERLKTLVGAKYHELGLGYILETRTYLTADDIKGKEYPIWDPLSNTMSSEEGICSEAAIIWAFNEDKTLINNLYMNDQCSEDFTESIAYEDIQPGDVFFIDWPEEDPETGLWVPDGQYDEVGIVIPPQYDPDTLMYEDCIRVIPPSVDGEDGYVQYSSTKLVNVMGKNGFVDYKSLPDKPRGGKSPYPKIPGKYKKSI